jgi:glyoxylase-like metal-dependent hydrolase (beta-lactamase superfamily II)
MTEQILPALHRIVVPLPESPLKEVNSYVLTSRERNVVIDTGLNRPECREALLGGLDEIGVDLERTDFVATHFHADHHALIPELIRPGRQAAMGAVDADLMRVGFHSEAGGMSDYLIRSGFPRPDLEASLREHPAFRYRSERQVEFRPLRQGDVIEVGDYRFETIDTPGHSPGHVSFYERTKRIFLAGDHVLGDITPNIQAWSDDHDPLAEFLASLRKVEPLEVEICLPGHRSLIADFQGRIAELIEHHRHRTEEALEVVGRGPQSAYQVAASMRWRIRARSWEDFPVMQRWFATGETIAHLRFLEEQGRVERQEREGRILYAASG